MREQVNRLTQLLTKEIQLNINISSETNFLEKLSKTQYGLILLWSAYLYNLEYHLLFFVRNHMEHYPKHVWSFQLDRGQLGTGKFW